jgi:amino acid transporter
LVTYLVINICNPVLFRTRFRSEFHWARNIVVPILGVAVTCYFMYKGFFQVLWNSNFETGRSVVLAALLLLAATGVVAWIIARNPEKREAASREATGGDIPSGDVPLASADLEDA